MVHRTNIVQRTTYSVPNGGRGPQKEVPVGSPQQRPQDAGEGEVRVADATEEGRMRAIVQRSYGSPEVLESAGVDRPAVGADDLLGWVRAAYAHTADTFLI